MENQSNQATKKGLILLLGVIVGLLTGVLVTFVMVNKLNNRSQKNDEVAQPLPSKGTSDTIYKYIVHQYVPGSSEAKSSSSSDSLAYDSTFVDESSMDYMLDDEEPLANSEIESANVSSSKLVFKYEAPIIYFDASKNAIEAPANAPKYVEVQFWSTPIHNKVVYMFENNVLKIKGLKSNEVYVINFKNHYYLQNDKRVYQISPSNEYKRLTEIQEGTFF
jgi:hypothetical protein